MLRILGLEITGGRLAMRMLLGGLLAFFTFVILYLLPLDIVELAIGAVPAQMEAQIAPILASLIHPALPPLGLALTPVVFLLIVLRGSKIYGSLVVLEGALSFTYVFFAFQGGIFSVNIPSSLLSSISGLPAGVSISIVLQSNLVLLMVLFLLPSVLIAVKGIGLILKKQPTPVPGA